MKVEYKVFVSIDPADLERMINSAVCMGFRLAGPVQVAMDGYGSRYVATMERSSPNTL